MPESSADALARLYDLDVAEAPGDLDLYLALAARAAGPVVELAAGTGRLAVPLAEAGYEVLAVDIDPAMLRRARERAGEAGRHATDRLELLEADLLAIDEPPLRERHGRYALAFIALNSILLLTTAERQRGALRSLARLLRPGGIGVVDAWLPAPADLVAFDGRLSLEWIREDPATGETVTKTVAAWFDPAARLVTLHGLFDAGRTGGPTRRWTRTDALRLVTPDELGDAAAAAGLVVEQLAGDHALGPLEPGSDRVVLVARRPEETARS